MGPHAKKRVLAGGTGDVEVIIELAHSELTNDVEHALRGVGARSVRAIHGAFLTATLPIAGLEAAAQLDGVTFLEVGGTFRR
jgi:hypothetical protein